MYSRTTDATDEPLSLQEAMDQLYLTTDEVNSEEVDAMIAEARALWETDSNVLLGSQTWKLVLDQFPASGTIIFEKAPVTAITSVQYYDTADTIQTLATSEYWTELTRKQAIIRVKDDWPDTYDDRPGAVIITFEAGYTTVPNDIKRALKQLVGNYYANRQETILMPGITAAQTTNGYEHILKKYKIYASNWTI